MKSDYIVTEPPARRPHPHLRLTAITLAAIGVAFYLAGDDAANSSTALSAKNPTSKATTSTSGGASLLSDLAPIGLAEAAYSPPEIAPVVADIPTATTPSLEIESTTPEAEASTPQDTLYITRSMTVREGDSLSLLFDRHGLATADWISLSRLKGDARRLLRMQPGDELLARLDAEQKLQQISLRINETQTLVIARNDQGQFTQSMLTDVVDTVPVTARGSIEHSLFLGAKQAGLSDRLTMELTDIFAWDIDFALDIRNGDSFLLVYEEVHKDGVKVRDGNILAAEFTNRGKTLRAVRYTDADGRSGYYSPDGRPMKKAFLRSPVDFTRISSRFSTGRKHPILNTIRAHRGVDYAAARGTPIKSAGAGKVIFAGVKGGYGNTVIVQHGGKYKTLYAHLDNFRRGIRRGASVNQGQVIGYVGSSGLATGPHLHYEFQVHDQHVNPLTVKLPEAPPIAASELDRFRTQVSALLAQLDDAADSNTDLAMAEGATRSN